MTFSSSNIMNVTKIFNCSIIEVTCPKLPLPANAIHLDRACDGANSDCNSYCSLDCKPGYKLSGNKFVTCHGSGKWDKIQGSCVGE